MAPENTAIRAARTGKRMDDSRLEFEYKTLQKRVLHDSRSSYTLMTALVALGEAVFAAVLVDIDPLSPVQKIGAAIGSMAALSIWWFIDSRFVWAEKRRIKRMEQIEKRLLMLNELLFDIEEIENEDEDTEELIEKMKQLDKESWIFSKVRVRTLYLGFLLLMAVAWSLVVMS